MKNYAKTLKTTGLLCCFFIGFVANSNAQGLLDRVVRRSKQKIGRKVEDLLVEKASEAISRKVYRSMSDAFDKMILDAVEQDSSYRANYGDSVAIKYGTMANSWMMRMNEAADVPEQYDFDTKLHVEVTSGKDVSNMILYLSKGQPVFAMEQQEGSDTRIFLMDTEKDVTVLYQIDKKGKKTAQAIPNMMGLGMAIVASQEDVDDDDDPWSFEATGKTKQILGYTAKEYKGADSANETTFYLTNDLEVNWRSSFAGILEKFASTSYQESTEGMDGLLLESYTEKKKGRKTEHSSWITEKIDQEAFSITNADYEFGGLATDESKE